MEKPKFLLNFFNSPFFQAILIIITSLTLYILTLNSFNKFNNFDPEPMVHSTSQTELKNLIPIETGFYIRNFIKFNVPRNDFIFQGIVWFIIDPKKVPMDLLGKFSFSKGKFIKNEVMNDSNPIIKDLSDGRKFVQYDVEVKFSSNLNYKLFPLDSHRLYITLNNKYLDARNFYFDINMDRFLISKNIYTFGWQEIANQFKSGFSEIKLNKINNFESLKIPRIIFSLDFMSTSMRNAVLIIMPLFILFLLFLFSLLFDPVKSPILANYSSAAVPAILAFRFVIETISPKVSYYMLSDKIFNLFLILSFLIFFIDTFYSQKLKQMKGLIVFCFHILLITGWYFILNFWNS